MLAAGGPWTCSPVWSPDSGSTSGVYSNAHPTGTVASEVVASGRVQRGYGGIRNPHNAVWITLMQSDGGDLLADLLDDQAGVYETWAESHGHDVAERVVLRALEYARFLNGVRL
jgi:hypothetical protein